ncbi:MAG TPA: DUF4383 domain-containing protein [Micromonosporaceae bacterium]|jgi:hypothetical protein
MAEQHGIPVNHPMRPFYRFLAGLCGLYILIFGIIALTKTSGTPAFSQSANDNVWVLGLRANLGFAIISIIAGAVILVGALIGRNLDRHINTYGGVVFMLVGMAMLLLLQTDANFLTFSMSNCVASFIIGTVLFSAGLYGKTGPALAKKDPNLQTVAN